MAVYGVNTATGAVTNGVIPFTGWSPTLSVGPANAGSSAGAVMFNGLSQNDYFIMGYNSKPSSRAITAILKAVTGAGAGGNATSSYRRVSAVQGGQNGGLIQTEVVNPVNRATTAADVAALQALWNRVVNPSVYAPDLSGAGGGSKLSFIGVS